MKSTVKVVIVMGSQSDLKVMKEASSFLERFGVPCSTQILSAHRTPQLLEKCAQQWEAFGVKVIIAGAGGAAHLPGMLASFSVLPVIGVPVSSKAMSGLDSLLSIVQMPKGVPVATVAVDNAANAAHLAVEMLALENSAEGLRLRSRLVRHKKNISRQVLADRKKLNRLGVAQFLKRGR